MTIRRLTCITALAVGFIPAALLPTSAGNAWGEEGPEGGEDQSDADDQGDADDEEGAGLGLSGSLTLDNAVGIGSFYRADSTDIVPALTFIVDWLIPGTQDMYLSARQDFTLFGLGSVSAYTDQDPGEDVRAADTLITWATGKLLKDELLTGISLSGSLRLYVPMSNASQARTLILGVGPGLALKRKFGFVTLTASTRAKYNFQRFDNQVLTVDSDQDDGAAGVRSASQGCVSRGNSRNTALRDDEVACGGSQNADWTWYHGFEALFQVTPSLTASISLSIINSFGIPIELDDKSPQAARTTGNETQRDTSWGIVDLTYAVNDHLDLSTGISSPQAAKSADGRRLRFPWWDFEGPQANNTSLYFDVTGSF